MLPLPSLQTVARRTSIFGLLVIFISSCVPYRQWQRVTTGPTTPITPDYRINVVEFDDMGEFWTLASTPEEEAKTQLSAALKTIQDAKGCDADGKHCHPVTVVVFVHGWNNNASDRAQNSLPSFATLLRRYREARVESL